MDPSGQAKMNDAKRFRDVYAEEANVYHRLRYESRYGKLFQPLHHEGISETLAPLDHDLSLLEATCSSRRWRCVVGVKRLADQPKQVFS